MGRYKYFLNQEIIEGKKLTEEAISCGDLITTYIQGVILLSESNPKGIDFGRSWVCSPWVSHGFTRRGSVVLVICSSWVSCGFASRGSIVGLLAVDQWCSSFARRGSVVGLLAVGQSWVCLPWISGARRGFARRGSVVLVVCSPWVKRGFARCGCVVGLLAVGLGLHLVGVSWVCSSWVWVLFAVG
nr:hypothetical protein CFP56_33242 [Quercus suber]